MRSNGDDGAREAGVDGVARRPPRVAFAVISGRGHDHGAGAHGPQKGGLEGGPQPPFAAAPYVDRTPFLTTALGRGPFSDSPTYTSATRHRLLPGSRPELFVAQKIALLRYRPWMRLTDGLHYVGETRLSPRALLFGHFKYTAAFRAKAVAEVARGQHFNNAEEYRKYLDLITEGRDQIHDPAVSVHWTESPFVQAILTTGQPPPPQPR